MDKTPAAMEPSRGPFMTKFKAAFGLLFAINVSVGAYLFYKAGNKTKEKEHEKGRLVSGAKRSKFHQDNKKRTQSTENVPETASLLTPPSIRVDSDGGKKQMQISVDEQHKLFKWILEEKRKVKPVSESNKARINEEKALLKHYIRTQHIPPF